MHTVATKTQCNWSTSCHWPWEREHASLWISLSDWPLMMQGFCDRHEIFDRLTHDFWSNTLPQWWSSAEVRYDVLTSADVTQFLLCVWDSFMKNKNNPEGSTSFLMFASTRSCTVNQRVSCQQRTPSYDAMQVAMLLYYPVKNNVVCVLYYDIHNVMMRA